MPDLDFDDDPMGYNQQIKALERQRTSTAAAIFGGLFVIWLLKGSEIPANVQLITMAVALGFSVLLSKLHTERLRRLIDKAKQDGVKLRR